MENQIDILQTSDIKTSAYLLSAGVSLVRIIKNNPQKIVFCFPQNQEVKRVLQLYWTNKAQVNPRNLFDNFDYLKDLIHRDYDI